VSFTEKCGLSVEGFVLLGAGTSGLRPNARFRGTRCEHYGARLREISVALEPWIAGLSVSLHPRPITASSESGKSTYPVFTAAGCGLFGDWSLPGPI